MNTREYLAWAYGLGCRIQIWHLAPGATSSADGRWDTAPAGQAPTFECPIHLYRVHPDDMHLIYAVIALPMSAAPRDSSMIRLLVKFDEHSTEDSPHPCWTVGFNEFDLNDEDSWHIAGWCWDHDHFTEGKGTLIGWLPMLDSVAIEPASIALADVHVDVVRIPAQKGLDPITAYFEDYAPGKGRVTVACYGDAWTACWSAMGGRKVREFTASVDAGYLSGAMLALRGSNKAARRYAKRVAHALIEAIAQAQPEGQN